MSLMVTMAMTARRCDDTSSHVDFFSVVKESSVNRRGFAPPGLLRALWARSTKNPDVSTGPLTRPFARLLALLTRTAHSFACSALLALLTRSAVHLLRCSLARSLISELVGK